MQATSPIEGVGLDEYIRARARLEHEPHAIDAVLALLSLPDAHAWRRVEQGWRDRMEKNERIARIVGEFLDDYVQELRGHSTADGGEDDAEPAAVAHLPVPRDVPSFMQRQGAEEDAALVAPAAPIPHQVALGYGNDIDMTQPPLLRPGSAALPFATGHHLEAGGARAPSFQTEALDLASLQRPVIPFGAPVAAVPPSGVPRVDDGDQTAFIPRHRLVEHAGPSEMTIEGYASVSAALAGEEAQEQVLARFGLTRDAWVAEMRRMSERFGAEPPLRARYLELVRRALGHAPA